MTHLVLLLLCIAAFACLALAMERHQCDRFGHALTHGQTRVLRAAGWLLLVVALWLSIAAMGTSFGLVAYSGHTSLAAGLVFLALLALERRTAARQPRRR
ncbi:DUF3325 domain-containing protein [Verticiella sediminum]|uniref:DUF3325 domain-containing protein n=1 Tax=Verticiella sediminum TaxID=1247510 RepID=A0A556B244_9BURK|nr:DUF3325 domain-containing protein [Verticiella sediminum]TSH98835.1 DUF3325 domain-containing protein [Verticiella sediminum]